MIMLVWYLGAGGQGQQCTLAHTGIMFSGQAPHGMVSAVCMGRVVCSSISALMRLEIVLMCC